MRQIIGIFDIGLFFKNVHLPTAEGAAQNRKSEKLPISKVWGPTDL